MLGKTLGSVVKQRVPHLKGHPTSPPSVCVRTECGGGGGGEVADCHSIWLLSTIFPGHSPLRAQEIQTNSAFLINLICVLMRLVCGPVMLTNMAMKSPE